jgi:hypothetical protein
MRAIVNVATGHYVRGQERLTEWCSAHDVEYFNWRDQLPAGSPKHQDVPYAFKAFALRSAQAGGARTLLWADACILPIKPLEPLWERIERDGYWISSQSGPEPDQGYTNYEWTADAAYPDLFKPDLLTHPDLKEADLIQQSFVIRLVNRTIPHVVATTFGISLDHPTGRAILDEYFRLASTTKAFCGPWINRNGAEAAFPDSMPAGQSAPCGPPDVRGHRHDQTALSVIAWRLGCKLTRWPEVFAYRGHEDERTILCADARY